MRIDGSGALVAGGASGLGEATARLPHAHGGRVAIADLNEERGDRAGRIRVCAIAAGTFDTPLLGALPQAARDALGTAVPFPARLGRPEEFAALAVHIVENEMRGGEVIRLDGALRMPRR